MIISKASYERGFGHGCVYKTHSYDLDDEEKQQSRKGGTTKPSLVFSNVHRFADGDYTAGPSFASLQAESINVERFCPDLDDDGLPFEGVAVQFDDPLICMVDMCTGEHRVIKHKEHEAAYVDTVRIIGASSKGRGDKAASLRRVSITLRYNRNPVIGDKFSSRHGQKGTLSVLWPQESMPFSESGMSPDVLINPHAYPSRMTIGEATHTLTGLVLMISSCPMIMTDCVAGMLIESMAGKSGAMHGMFQDATPFQFHEEQKVVDYVGHQLRATGYNYCGSEPLYNGLTGEVMHADIFMGVVFYQRLRLVGICLLLPQIPP
jgi:DNA-directed RNA polymerase I subunit RPA2